MCEELVQGVITFVAVWLAAHFGLKGFFSQKEYELVKERYLEGAIDVVAAHCEEILGIYDHNWTRCLQILNAFLGTKSDFDPRELEQGFLRLDLSNFNVIAHYRLQYLVGSDIFWKIYQLAMAFAANANEQATKEIPDAIQIILTGKVSTDIDQIVDSLITKLEERQKERERYSILTYELEFLAEFLQMKKFTFKEIQKFRDQAQVRATVDRLEKAFPLLRG